MASYKVGDSVQVKTNRFGTIQWIGEAKNFGSGIWYGIELKQKRGSNDGESKGHKFFKCKFGFGIYVQKRMIVKLIIHNNRNNSIKKRTNDDMDDKLQITFAFYTLADEVVCGYIRQIENSLISNRNYTYIGIPIEVIDICLQYYCPKFTKLQNELLYAQLPLLSTTVPYYELDSLLKNKLYLCRAKCDFMIGHTTNAHKFETNIIEKLLLDQMKILILKKTAILSELSTFFSKHTIEQATFKQIIKMSASNLFRDLRYQKYDYYNNSNTGNDNAYCDPNWDHLKPIYDLLWRAINSSNISAAIVVKYTEQYMVNLFQLFHSRNENERTYLMMIVHKIYGRCLHMRPFISELIGTYFDGIVHSNDKDDWYGVVALLRIVCALFPGLSVPIKNEWKLFFKKCVSLFQCRQLLVFWEELTQSVVNFAAKDVDGCFIALQALVDYWPSVLSHNDDIENKNAESFIIIVINVINVLLEHIDCKKMANEREKLRKSMHLFNLVMERICGALMSYKINYDISRRALAALEQDAMIRFVKEVVPGYIPKINGLLVNMKEEITPFADVGNDHNVITHIKQSILIYE